LGKDRECEYACVSHDRNYALMGTWNCVSRIRTLGHIHALRFRDAGDIPRALMHPAISHPRVLHSRRSIGAVMMPGDSLRAICRPVLGRSDPCVPIDWFAPVRVQISRF
jgi:hypothetical protein